MKSISFLAKHNPWKARLIIVLSHILLIVIACWVGLKIFSYDFQLPAFLLYLFVLIFIIAAAFYPSVKKKNYLRQKISDFSLAASTFCMIVCLANNQSVSTTIFNTTNASSNSSVVAGKETPKAEQILASLKYRDKNTLTKTEKRILKKAFKDQLTIYAKAKLTGNKNAASDAALIILAIVAALGLLYVVVALACSISCNGSEGAAIVLAVLGSAAIILGLVLVIKRLNRGPREKEVETIESQ